MKYSPGAIYFMAGLLASIVLCAIVLFTAVVN